MVPAEKIIVRIALLLGLIALLLLIFNPPEMEPDPFTRGVQEEKARQDKMSAWESNQEFLKELERAEIAGRLDEAARERKEIDKYRTYK